MRSSTRIPPSPKHPTAAPIPWCLLCLPILLGTALPGVVGAPLASAPAPFRLTSLAFPSDGQPGFTALSSRDTGVHFANFLPLERHLTNQMLLNGSGVAAGDVDGDGLCDLFFSALEGSCALYRNLGQWRFENIARAAGVACANLGCTGAALVDLDGDGDLDLVVNTFGRGTRVFYNDGRARFTEAFVDAPLNPGRAGTSLAFGDLDGDGFVDLYLANYRLEALMDAGTAYFEFATVQGRKIVSRVNGRPVTDPALTNRFLVSPTGGIDELGEPDLLYRNVGGTNFVPVPFTGGAFLDEAGLPLAETPRDWGLSVMIRDFNADGLPDLYVCNDFLTADRFWLNQGDGRFRAPPWFTLRHTTHFTMGLDVADVDRDGLDDFLLLDMASRDRRQAMTVQPSSRPEFPVPGVFTNRPQYMQTMLFVNRGDQTYAELGQLAGLAASDWAWTPAFLDVDLDGWEDLLIANGNERDGRNLDIAERLRQFRAEKPRSNLEVLRARRMFPRFDTPNLAFRNRRDLTFEEVGRTWGFDFKGVSHGLALADLDNDGDLDVMVNNLNDVALLCRNNATAPRVAVRLHGLVPNTAGLGARIAVRGGPVPQTQEIVAGGRYLSSDQAQRTFAAGTLTNRLLIEVAWRSGRRSVIPDVAPNTLVEIFEAGAQPGTPPSPKPPRSSIPQPAVTPATATDTDADPHRVTGPAPPFFARVPLDHRHVDEPFDDYARQPTLPRKLSQPGPAVAWLDIDADGWDDLIVTGGKGGALAIFRNHTRGGFAPLQPTVPAPVTRDQTAVLPWPNADGRLALLVGQSNYEDGLALGAAVREIDPRSGAATDLVPAWTSSLGPLALADIDFDGDLDLFAGGRVTPGRYPEAAASACFRNEHGRLVRDAENSAALARLGLVSGAVFADLDGDGDDDLLVACEWGPIRLLRNDAGRFREWNPALTWPASSDGPDARAPAPDVPGSLRTLSQLTGWWNGVATGDFDGDGRLDILASNWGRNTRYQNHRVRALQLWYGDHDQDGTLELVEAYFEPDMRAVVPERGLDFLARALPYLRSQFTTYQAFGTASVETVLGEHRDAFNVLEAAWLETTLFLNRGDRLEVRVLPLEAQTTPAFAAAVGDLDGDGHEDVFLSQNFFAQQPDAVRLDAGRGLWLRGDGRGGLTPVPAHASGLEVYGEQRGAALADFDRDGRLDLAVTQNAAETVVYRNRGARPGLRVRLVGPTLNPLGVGAVVRVETDGRWGPARAVQAGSGYAAHAGAVQVFGTPTPPTRVRVRWPGGRTVEVPVPPGAREVAVKISD